MKRSGLDLATIKRLSRNYDPRVQKDEVIEWYRWNGIPMHWWADELPVRKQYVLLFHRQKPDECLLYGYVDLVRFWMHKKALAISQERFPYL